MVSKQVGYVYRAAIAVALAAAACLVVASPATASPVFTPKPWPEVSAVSPSVGGAAGGERITIRGSGFTAHTAVYFGRARGLSVHVVSVNRLLVTTPAHPAGQVWVHVSTAPHVLSFPSNGSLFRYAGTPRVTRLAWSASRTTGGGRMTVYGTDLFRVRAVRFGSASGGAIHVVNENRLIVTVPPHSAGSVDVLVITAYGTSAPSTASHFYYGAPPTITSIDPGQARAGLMTRLIVTGTGFVYLKGADIAGQQTVAARISDTQIEVYAPPLPAGPATLTVETAFGTGSTTITYQ